MTGTWAKNSLTEVLGIDLPIVLGPFGGASSAELVSSVSNAGGLGSYGLYGLTAKKITDVAAEIRELTDRPFALNLWLPMDEAHAQPPSQAEFDAYVETSYRSQSRSTQRSPRSRKC
jgi:nitronate monooxygenase